jgi:molybdate transport system substrate-binding protein
LYYSQIGYICNEREREIFVKTAKSGFVSRFVSAALALAMVLMLAACGQTANNSSDSAAADSAVATSSAVSAAASAQASDTPAVSLQIFAANSLQKALPEVQALYTEINPEVTFAESQFLGSGELVSKLKAEPAAADVLITASKGTMDDAENNGSIDVSTRNDLFANDLVIVAKAGSGLTIADLNDIVRDDISKIAIGEPGTVPAGVYANQALNSIGLYSTDTGKEGEYQEGIAGKVVQESSVGNVAKTVANGDAQIGFVYSSDVYRFDGLDVIFTVPASAHKAIIYPGAVVQASSNAGTAADFLNFCVTDPEALVIFSKYGFEVK